MFQLEKDRDGLFALRDDNGRALEGSPKLSLLMNCFGAELEPIRELSHLNSMELCLEEEVRELVSSLPNDQQTIVLYTQEYLLRGNIPFGQHRCALCDCVTASREAHREE